MPTLSVTTVIDRPAAQVWSIVRDFRDPSAWYPLPVVDGAGARAAGTATDGPPPRLRVVRTPAGELLSERLVEHDDTARHYTYEVLGLDRHPCGIRLTGACVATLHVESIIGGTMARVEWSVRYACPEDSAERARDQVRRLERDLFRPALRELRRKLS
ncbi:SRPBCC family protein [Yinghuangia seranimata]|uniref:SRPBCC family protein n=1 Tax=Yinghuangia seranimata TaxID=408067 RepID=UPI00248C70AB|nr:SRPBCC family protein [Yinghuangia seranimata]MDI2130989.1 SRPBCC family protein [Yinghuangia seranimata]